MAKELFIFDGLDADFYEDTWGVVYSTEKSDVKEPLHMIEYSAYEKLKNHIKEFCCCSACHNLMVPKAKSWLEE